jgi:hypothetical protein
MVSKPALPLAHPVKGAGWASFAALGVVFGDLGTSPLYTLQTVVQATGGQFTPQSALGVLSAIVWTLIITISVKYCVFVMRADNHGEGGILALMSLVGANGFVPGFRVMTGMGLLGAALIYGDGVITPAISVLSALEGVNVVTASFKPFVMPMAVAILLGLFAVQRFGTEKIGRTFGPVMLVWFSVIAILGVASIVRHPGVVVALNPRYAVDFLRHSGSVGFLVLGGVFLCITGGEALYADMGHFGKAPIRRAWYVVVLPNRVSARAPLRERQPVLHDRAVVVDFSAGRAGDARHHHRQPSHHHGLVLHDPSGHATRLAAGRIDSPDLGSGLWADLRAGRELAIDGRHRGDDRRIRQLGPARGRVRNGGRHHHAADHAAAVQGDARSVDLAARRRHGRRRLSALGR